MRNKILIAITTVAAIIFVLGGISLDSEGYVPAIMCLISGMWIVPFTIANAERIDRYE